MGAVLGHTCPGVISAHSQRQLVRRGALSRPHHSRMYWMTRIMVSSCTLLSGAARTSVGVTAGGFGNTEGGMT